MKRIILVLLIVMTMVSCSSGNMESKLQGEWIVVDQQVELSLNLNGITTVSTKRFYDVETKEFKSTQYNDGDESTPYITEIGEAYATKYTFDGSTVHMISDANDYDIDNSIKFTSKNEFIIKATDDNGNQNLSPVEYYGVPNKIVSVSDTELVLEIILDEAYLNASGEDEYLVGYQSTVKLQKVQ